MPAIASAALLIFIFDFTSFGVILVLGGPRFATLEVEIYNQTISLFNLPLAAVLSIIQLGVYAGFDRPLHPPDRTTVPPALPAPAVIPGTQTVSLAKPAPGRPVSGALFSLLTLPLIALVTRSLSALNDQRRELGTSRPSQRWIITAI